MLQFAISAALLALVPRAAVPRRGAILAGAAWAGAMIPTASRADLPYCIPGVTADRCRGVFWETGKLYRKESSSSAIPSAEEYSDARGSLIAMRKSLVDGARDQPAYVGLAAAGARATLRKTGGFVCRALEEEARYDSEFLLNEVMAALDEVDRESLGSNDADAAPGFGRASLSLDGAMKRLDAFLAALPDQPTAFL